MLLPEIIHHTRPHAAGQQTAGVIRPGGLIALLIVATLSFTT